MTLTQDGRGLINLYYGLRRRKEADLHQHAWGIESSLSMLDLRKVADCTTPNQTLNARA